MSLNSYRFLNKVSSSELYSLNKINNLKINSDIIILF